MLLRLLGILPAGAEVTVTPLRPETAPAVVLPDYVAVLAVEADDPFTFHVEFQLNYHNDVPRTMARYGGSLAWQYGRRVVSVLLLLRPSRVPEVIPRAGQYDIGDTRTTHPFLVVRLWEIDPAPILESADPRMLPWAMLMNSNDAEVRKVADALARHGDQESIGRFLTLGGLRYDRSLLEEMLGGPKMGLVQAILEGSSIVREVVDQARAEAQAEGRAAGEAQGRTEGRTEGRADEARRLLRISLGAKFPGLETMPEIDAIPGIETLESLLVDHVLQATDRAGVARAIADAAPPPNIAN